MSRTIEEIVLLVLVLLSSSSCLIREIGGAFKHEPEELPKQASVGAKKLIEQAFAAIDPARLVDYHTHVLGLGAGGTGAFANPKMQEGFSTERVKFLVYTSAAGVKNLGTADQDFIERLVRLARAIRPAGGKHRILAFDKFYNPDGSVDLRKTNFYMPNERVFKLAQDYPDVFLPVISIHPYRSDALGELDKWASQGTRFIKWLPNAMGMDPADPRIDAFYRKMKDYRMVLLSHTGEEQAVEAAEDQRWGNPLRFRRALDHGVRVVMAHAASLGECEDLDRAGKPVSCFELFLRLMGEVKYDGLLFGEISAMPQFNRMPGPMASLLSRPELHRRLVNGSDYPLPAINIVIRTRELVREGFISAEERSYLNEIYDYNPLLFDFVLKRTLRHPQSGGKLSAAVFMRNELLEN